MLHGGMPHGGIASSEGRLLWLHETISVAVFNSRTKQSAAGVLVAGHRGGIRNELRWTRG